MPQGSATRSSPSTYEMGRSFSDSVLSSTQTLPPPVLMNTPNWWSNRRLPSRHSQLQSLNSRHGVSCTTRVRPMRREHVFTFFVGVTLSFSLCACLRVSLFLVIVFVVHDSLLTCILTC